MLEIRSAVEGTGRLMEGMRRRWNYVLFLFFWIGVLHNVKCSIRFGVGSWSVVLLAMGGAGLWVWDN